MNRTAELRFLRNQQRSWDDALAIMRRSGEFTFLMTDGRPVLHHYNINSRTLVTK